MSMKSKLEQSRDKWKKKAVKRAKTEHYLRKENNRIKKERNQYKRELRGAKKQLQTESCKNILPIDSKKDVIFLALQLFLIAGISFRGVSKVLKVIGVYLGLAKTPCTQTVINWVIRLSIARTQNAKHLVGSLTPQTSFSNGFIAILDISIGLGAGKILTVIFVDSKHHVINEEALTLQNVACVAVAVADSWTGETISVFLQKTIATMGKPVAYLKDGGRDLAKAVRLLNEQNYSISSIDDVSHVIANILKREYQDHPMFETFLSTCGKVSKRFKQTILACLVPPKVSTKSRFMNLHRLVRWADKILKHSPKGRAPKDSLLSKLRANFEKLPECRAFISRFLRDANVFLACQKILKTKGLRQDTYEDCQQLLEAIPQRSVVRIRFTNWLEEQLLVATNLGLDTMGMPISSDIIESLFGIAKQHGTGEVKDANRIALRIPAMCGQLTEKDAQSVLNISSKVQQEVVGSLPSLVKQRRQVLPNAGCLDRIQSDNKTQNLELIPGAKNQSKNAIITNISNDYRNTIVPLLDSKNLPEQTPKAEETEVAA